MTSTLDDKSKRLKNIKEISELDVTDWKRVWQLVSGIHYSTSESLVKESLFEKSKEIQDGLFQFKKPKTFNNDDLEKLLKSLKQEKLLPFTTKLQYILDLEPAQCWDVLCYYLAKEFRGTANSLPLLTATESNMTKFLDDIWRYYTLQRMVFLKLVKNLLEFYQNQYHPYHEQYKEILDKITLEKLKTSYLKQLEFLIKETPPLKLTGGEFWNYQAKLCDWNERNCKETIEILHILILIVHFVGVTVEEVTQLMEYFKMHSFGRQQRFLNESNELHLQLIRKIGYSEIILFMKCIDVSQKDTDSAWIYNVIKNLDESITSIKHGPSSSQLCPEHGPLLLSWMLFNFRVIDSETDDIATRKFRQYGGKAVQLDVFNSFKNIVTHQMFEDDSLISRVARKTVYNYLNHLCELFDDGSIGKHNGVYDLLSELLHTPLIAKHFVQNEDCGIRSLYTGLLENFPIDFYSISKIFLALSKAGKYNFVKEQFQQLPIYTEFYDECKHKLMPLGNDEYITTQPYTPFKGIDYVIPIKTSAAILSHDNGAFVHFRIPVNYFDVLQNEMNNLLSYVTQYVEIDVNRFKNINAGVEYLSFVISKIEKPQDIAPEMVFPTEMCIDILNKFKNIFNPPIELLANCLNVCTSLLSNFKNEISSRIANLNILPSVTSENLDFIKYAQGVSFDSNIVGTYLINYERKIEKYDFLISYINFLKEYSNINMEQVVPNNLFVFEIPGLIFLLREVFPHLHSWRFRSSFERNRIYKETLEYFCEILNIHIKNSEITNQNSKKILKDICIYNLLNSDNGIALLKFIAIGNPFLQMSMEMEANWLSSSSCGVIRLVRLSMKILMHLLRLKSSLFNQNGLSPLESLIYAQPKQRDTLRIIPVVTSYINNIFDRSLPILSCRLLRRIALEFNMSLLACLDMEPDQIRLIFLQSLPDDLESDDLKIAILEFVEACIEKQPGLTEAFFKINNEKEKRIFAPKKEFNIADSIVFFMEIYLSSVLETPEIIENDIPTRIMSLFHSLWKSGRQILVKNLLEQKTFWNSLCSPLFAKQFKPKIKAYNQILNILGMEIFISSSENNVDESLQKVIDKFFEKSFFEKWTKFVFDLPKICVEDYIADETPDWLCRLQSFKEFIVIILKKNLKDFEIPNSQKKFLAMKTLEILVQRSEYTDDLRPFVILSELYLIVLNSFNHTYTQNLHEDQEMLTFTTKLLNNLSICYEDLHIRAKMSCLAITIKAADLLATELTKDIHNALNFLYPIVNIICYELSDLEKTVRIELHDKTAGYNRKENQETQSQKCNFNDENTPLILSLNLLKTIASIFHDEGPSNWDTPFHSNRVFNRLLSCTAWIIQLNSKHKLSIELLDVLIVFAKGNCSHEFLYCDIGDYLWLKLIPPKELTENNYMMQQNLMKPNQNRWLVENWWPIYSRGIELVTILLEKHRYQFLKDVLLFVGIHEEYLMDCIFLAKQSLEPRAMALIKNVIYMICLLSEYESEWQLDHQQSLYNLKKSVQFLLGHLISLFNQQRNLRRLMQGVNVQIDPIKELNNTYFPDDIVIILNELVEIVAVCAKCLLNFSPNLLNFICEPQFLISKWEFIFDIQFGPPKLNDYSNQLTFGTVLNIVGILTKSLNLQNSYGFNEIPLNEIPENITETQSTRSVSSSEKNCSTRVHFNKSMSIASVTSSVTAPPNEILSNLDGELCQMALEKVLTLIACQTFLALRNTNLSNREKQLIRREITTELITFHEFVRKKVLNDFRDHRDIWHRKKRGIMMMQINTTSNNGEEKSSTKKKSSASTKISSSGTSKPSMRVDVVRRQHLQHHLQNLNSGKQKQTFDMSVNLSPIIQKSDKLSNPSSSTPHIGKSTVRKTSFDDSSIKVICTERPTHDEENEEEIQYIEPIEPRYTPLSYVQLVEEDYLHFLSNIFHVICQND
ncbi:nucleoporin Nup188 [Condylostylus longicornis]|uniref:nucleoporin Nup188 n=1 Tax=Condylostylus longicornis TaxID=2530218 RepID=UPI00244E50F5|nr:nucleoporin Nup188 [Condylostylus longicornis]